MSFLDIAGKDKITGKSNHLVRYALLIKAKRLIFRLSSNTLDATKMELFLLPMNI